MRLHANRALPATIVRESLIPYLMDFVTLDSTVVEGQSLRDLSLMATTTHLAQGGFIKHINHQLHTYMNFAISVYSCYLSDRLPSCRFYLKILIFVVFMIFFPLYFSNSNVTDTCAAFLIDCVCPAVDFTTGGLCPAGYSCLQGSLKPVSCPGGLYCADPGLAVPTGKY